MTPILWRRAEMRDAPALSVLGGATFLASFAHDHPGGPLIDHIRNAHGEAYYRAALADPNRTVLIGETPLGAPVGYAMLTPPDLPVPVVEGQDVELKRFYLLGDWQGKGNGDALMERVMEQARAQKAQRLLLAVYPANEKARRFYARHGFAEIGETVFMVGDVPFRDLIYARSL
ncbi:GNAT family N-acetyltransferase [Sphingobium baderi]|uniref:Acetyltransferase n=1 Tax=Sphingobium baderi LL03 TaxID=1114964 RepID=T0GMM4_9SPHN|nr:GNAT family N-acetyltransferase [Sphingobium baderi]EQB01932.1 acetyltransferase [Sphingobium baderi LL03]KMS62195.1 GCN5 family acetyltransferase [Sphingobium baderi LL03]